MYHRTEVQLTQIKRYLSKLQALQFIKRKSVKGVPLYVLVEDSFVELLAMYSSSENLLRDEEILLINFFLCSYRDLLLKKIQPQGKIFTQWELQRMQDLIDPQFVLKNQKDIVMRIINDLQSRIAKNKMMQQYLDTALEEDRNSLEILDELDQKYSYQLSYRKSFGKFLREIPNELLQLELNSGLKMRNKYVFSHLLQIFEQKKSLLDELI